MRTTPASMYRDSMGKFCGKRGKIKLITCKWTDKVCLGRDQAFYKITALTFLCLQYTHGLIIVRRRRWRKWGRVGANVKSLVCSFQVRHITIAHAFLTLQKLGHCFILFSVLNGIFSIIRISYIVSYRNNTYRRSSSFQPNLPHALAVILLMCGNM